MRTAHAVAARAAALGALLLMALLLLPVGLAQAPDPDTGNLTAPGGSDGSGDTAGGSQDGGSGDVTDPNGGSGGGFGDVVAGLDLGDGILLSIGLTMGGFIVGLLFVGGTKFMNGGGSRGSLRATLLQRLRTDPGEELPILANELGTDVKTLRATLTQLEEDGLVEPRDLGNRTVYHPVELPGGARSGTMGEGQPVAQELEEECHRAGVTVLLRGDPGSGAALLARDLAAAEEHTLVLASTDPGDVLEADLLERNPRMVPHVVDLASDHFHHLCNGGDPAAGTSGNGHGPDYLDVAFESLLEHRPDRTLVERLDFLLELHPPDAVVRGVRAMSLANREAGGVLVLVKSPGTADTATEHLLEQVADVVLDVRAEQLGTGTHRELHVRKVRHAPHRVRTIPYRFSNDGHLVRDARTRIRGG